MSDWRFIFFLYYLGHIPLLFSFDYKEFENIKIKQNDVFILFFLHSSLQTYLWI